MAHELEARARDKGVVTIGEALEVAATVAGDKPVDESDAAAIQAAEMRATGTTAPPVSRLGLEAKAVAMANARRIYDEDRTTLAEVIGNAREKLEGDKPVSMRDAVKVRAAELQGDVEGLIGGHLLHDFPKESLTPGGVAETLATAATLNQPPSSLTLLYMLLTDDSIDLHYTYHLPKYPQNSFLITPFTRVFRSTITRFTLFYNNPRFTQVFEIDVAKR